MKKGAWIDFPCGWQPQNWSGFSPAGSPEIFGQSIRICISRHSRRPDGCSLWCGAFSMPWWQFPHTWFNTLTARLGKNVERHCCSMLHNLPSTFRGASSFPVSKIRCCYWCHRSVDSAGDCNDCDFQKNSSRCGWLEHSLSALAALRRLFEYRHISFESIRQWTELLFCGSVFYYIVFLRIAVLISQFFMLFPSNLWFYRINS